MTELAPPLLPMADAPAPDADDAASAALTARIITAAHRLLDTSGLEGVTIRAVLAAAGVNRRVFYERFADKDQLMLAVFAGAIQLITAESRAATAALADPMERLQVLVDYLIVGDPARQSPTEASVRRSAALCREHMRLAESRPGDLKQALRPLIDLMSEQLAEGMARGQVREGDPEELAAFVYNLVSTTVHAILLAQDMSRVAAVDRISLAERVWAFCRRGVAP